MLILKKIIKETKTMHNKKIYSLFCLFVTCMSISIQAMNNNHNQDQDKLIDSDTELDFNVTTELDTTEVLVDSLIVPQPITAIDELKMRNKPEQLKTMRDNLYIQIENYILKNQNLDFPLNRLFETHGGKEYFIHQAIQHDKINIIQLLIQCNINFDYTIPGMPSPLEDAIQKQNLEMIKLLVEEGNVPFDSQKNYFCFLYPILAKPLNKNQKSILAYIVQHGANINIHHQGNTMLRDILEAQNFELFLYFIELGANIYMPQQRDTLLHCAVNYLNMDFIRYLVTHNVNIDAQDSIGETPLIHVISSSYINNLINYYQNHVSISNTDLIQKKLADTIIQRISYLLDHGADINAKDNNRRTVLQHVWEISQLDFDIELSTVMYKIARYLVEHGACIHKSLINTAQFNITQQSSEIDKYLKLADEYETARLNNTVQNFLQTIVKPKDQGAIIDIALIQCFEKDLITMYNFNPTNNNVWISMLDQTQKLNIHKPVAFLLQQLNISSDEMYYILHNKNQYKKQKVAENKRLNLISNIFKQARQQDKKIFGRAIINYYLARSHMNNLAQKIGLNNDIASIIVAYKGFPESNNFYSRII